jgi:hypothetical protein
MPKPPDRTEQYFSQPFKPFNAPSTNADQGTMLRAATALEYIAAQLGQINAKLSQLLPDGSKAGTP